MMFEKGSVVEKSGVHRKIVDVIPIDTPHLECNTISYMWCYPSLEPGEDNLFWTGNSSDTELLRWKLICK